MTAHQPWSQWKDICADAMMIGAAVDRLVYPALTINIKADSLRQQGRAEVSSG